MDGFRGFHDRSRGRKGAFDRAMNAIDLLKTRHTLDKCDLCNWRTLAKLVELCGGRDGGK